MIGKGEILFSAYRGGSFWIWKRLPAALCPKYKKKNNIMLFQENYKAVHEIRLLSAVAVPDENNIIER